MPAIATWIGVPLLGGVIGYVTNRIAVKMIFRPIRPISVLGIRVQGLLARRQQELAESVGRVVGDHLVSHEDVMAALGNVDFEQVIGDVLDTALAPKVAELRKMPMLGALFTDERVGQLQESITRGIVAKRETLLSGIEGAIEKGLDVRSVVTAKVAAFPVEKLEALVLEVAARELRAIELLGALLGVLIGIVQVLLIWGL